MSVTLCAVIMRCTRSSYNLFHIKLISIDPYRQMPRCGVQFLTNCKQVYRLRYVGDCNRVVCGSFLVAKTPGLSLGTTHFGWVPRHLTLPCVKRPGSEAGHSSTSDAKFRNKWSYTLPFLPFAVCVNFLYTFQLLFDICAVVLVIVLRPVILKVLWNFEWFWRLRFRKLHILASPKVWNSFLIAIRNIYSVNSSIMKVTKS